MPLIDITTYEGWHADSIHTLAYQLGNGLPEAFVINAKSLYLDPHTPKNGVQVDYHEYHRFAINPADIWVLVRFTEDAPTEEQRLQVRETVGSMVEKALDDYHQAYEEAAGLLEPDDPALLAMQADRPRIAIDLFWGPGSGCLLHDKGGTTISHYW